MRGPGPDRFRLARINGAAGHYAHLRELTNEQEGEALAGITVAAAGRTDLLAHAAGILLGFNEGTTGEARAPAVPSGALAVPHGDSVKPRPLPVRLSEVPPTAATNGRSAG